MTNKELWDYLDAYSQKCKWQSRPTVLEILRDTPVKTAQDARELYKEWLLEKYKDEEKDESEEE
jgi:hypothetical protein